MGSSITATSIPLRGFGTFQADATLYPPGTAKKAVLEALKVGYRHIDTAYGYGNGEIEREVGQAIKESGIPRKEIFLVTKLHNTFHDPADVETGLNMCLENLGVDYVDLFLMHNPYAYAKGPKFSTLRREDGTGRPLMDMEMSRRYPDTWRAMHELVRKGKARQIGLSNFNILKTKRVIEETGIIPAANQVEMNPYFPQYELLDYCRSQNIQVIAHCPLGGALAPSVANRTGDGPLQDPTITKIAVAHDKTAAQVILAWLNGRGISVVPKSAKAERIRSNFDDWGSEKHFALTEAEDAEIAHLMGPRGEKGTRNLVNKHHIGFDVFDEALDQPV